MNVLNIAWITNGEDEEDEVPGVFIVPAHIYCEAITKWN